MKPPTMKHRQIRFKIHLKITQEKNKYFMESMREEFLRSNCSYSTFLHCLKDNNSCEGQNTVFEANGP